VPPLPPPDLPAAHSLRTPSSRRQPCHGASPLPPPELPAAGALRLRFPADSSGAGAVCRALLRRQSRSRRLRSQHIPIRRSRVGE